METFQSHLDTSSESKNAWNSLLLEEYQFPQQQENLLEMNPFLNLPFKRI